MVQQEQPRKEDLEREAEVTAEAGERRPLLEEPAPPRHEEDSLISKEHSLEYLSQTLETQSDHLLYGVLSALWEDILSPATDDWQDRALDQEVEEAGRNFKETQYSPKEKVDAQTQTEQETKSTQCSPNPSPISPSEVLRDSPLRVSRFYQSPRREVQTQTQGESKSVQCSLDDLESLSFSKTPDPEDSIDSPSRSERSSVKQSKSVQCIPEDITTSPSRSLDSVARSSAEDRHPRSPRREVEVQTYQESKAIQCSDDELLLEAERLSGGHQGRSSSGPAGSAKTESSASSSCGSPRKIPTVVFAEEPVDMTVTHRDHDGNVGWSRHWGPERLVEIYREPKTSLGLSIVGGKVRNATRLYCSDKNKNSTHCSGARTWNAAVPGRGGELGALGAVKASCRDGYSN